MRAAETGISINDLDKLSVGMLLDIFHERIKDYEEKQNGGALREATQDDFDNF